MAAVNAVRSAATLGISFVVARSVDSAQFGLVSFAIPLMTFIMIITDLGLISAIVRHPEIDRRTAGAAFVFFVVVGMAGGAALFASSRFFETSFGLPGLTSVLKGFGFVAAFTIWTSAPRAFLERALRYNAIAGVELFSLGLAVAVVTWCIFENVGIYSIIYYQLCLNLSRFLLFSFLGQTYFTPNFAFRILKPLLHVAGWVLMSNLVIYLARNIDNILVGRYLGAASLGIYGLAYQFMTLPLVLITWPVSGVLLSSLRKIGSDDAKKNAVILAVFCCTSAITFPMMAFLIFGADFPIQRIYSSHWDGLYFAVAVLAPAGALQSITSYCGTVLVDRGLVRTNMALSLGVAGSMVASFVFSVQFGLAVMMITYSVTSLVANLLNIVVISKWCGIGLCEIGRSLLPGLVAAGLGLAFTKFYFGNTAADIRHWLPGVAVYAAVVLVVLWSFRAKIAGHIAVLGSDI